MNLKLIVFFAGASGSTSDRRHAIAEFAQNYPQDPVDVIIADFMSEANMVTGAARRVDQDKAQANQDPAPPGYELSFLLALHPALENIAKHGIKLAVNAGNTDTEGLYKVVTQMVQAKGLGLKVKISGPFRLAVYSPRAGGLGFWRRGAANRPNCPSLGQIAVQKRIHGGTVV